MFIAIVTFWIICTVISLPPLFGFGEIRFSFTVSTCVPYLVGSTHVAQNFYYILFITAEAIVPVLTLFVMYTWILCIVRKSIVYQFRKSLSNRQRSMDCQNKDHMSTTNESVKAQLHLVSVFAVIFTANLITWLPMIALALTGACVGTGRIPDAIYTFAYLSFLSETVIHPILEVCLIQDMRNIITSYVSWCKQKFFLTPPTSKGLVLK